MKYGALAIWLCFAAAARAAAPDFDASAPPNRTVLYSYPGTSFVLELKIVDDDPAGTPEGMISVTSSIIEGSSIAQGFNPLASNPGAAPWISTTPFQKVNTTFLPGPENALQFHYQVTDIDTTDFAMIPNPYREICVEVRDGGDLPPEGWNRRCYRVFILSGPRYDEGCPYMPIQSPDHPDGQPVFVDYCPRLPLKIRSVVGVGQHFEANMYFADPNHDGTRECPGCRNISISVLADPGLPNGATLRETKGGPHADLFPADHTNLMTTNLGTQSAEPVFKHLFSRKLSFVPHAEQDLTYGICVDAVADDAQDSASRLCVQLEVVLPETEILDDPLSPHDPAPFPTGTMAEPAAVTSRARCKESFSITLYEAKDFNSEITQREHRAGFEQGLYVPTVRALPQHPLPEGFEVSELRRMRVCSDPFRTPSLSASVAEDGTLQTECRPEQQRFEVSQHLVSWQPPKGSEGSSATVCLSVQDFSLPAHVGSSVRCTVLAVRKCEVCVARGDTLLDLAKEFQTSWLQLWGANPALRNPHHLPEPEGQQQAVLALGPIVEVGRAQRLSVAAQRYEMTEDLLRLVNPDVAAEEEELEEGQRLCVMSALCTADLTAAQRLAH